MSQLAALAGMMAIAALGVDGESIPGFTDTARHPSIGSGRIVGWDNGKDKNKLQPRNAQCLCRSGKKAKKCCKFIESPNS